MIRSAGPLIQQMVIDANQLVAHALHVVHQEQTQDVSAVIQTLSITPDLTHVGASIGHPRMLEHIPQLSALATTQVDPQVCITEHAAITAMILRLTLVMRQHGKEAALTATAAHVDRTQEGDGWNITSIVATVKIKGLAQITVTPKI